MPDPVYTLIIGGQPWNGWETLSYSRSIERMGGSFQVTLMQKPEVGFLSATMRIGLPVQLEIDGQTVLDGYIDDVEHSYDEGSANISVAGRDKTGDLIDCAATVNGPFEFNNQRLEKIIAQVIKPFGITLAVDADTGAPFRRVAIQPGETAYAFIDRICRFRAILPVSDGIGGLVLVKPAGEKSPGRLVYGQNIRRGQVQMHGAERFSLYVLKGQAEGFDSSTAGEISAGEGRATDTRITRYRPTVIMAETQGFTQTLTERAEWERNVRRGRGNTATYTVPGWYADAATQTLWKPNTLVWVDDAARQINREMLITSMTLERGSQGTLTTLELAVPEAYELVAEVQPPEGGSGSAAGNGFEDYDLMELT